MASETELVERLREFLSMSDLNTTTTAAVRGKLEEDVGIDLSEREAFIGEQIDLYLQSQFQEAQEKEENDGGEEEENGEAAEEREGTDDVDPSNGRAAAKRRSKKNNKGVKKRGGGGLAKLCRLSPELQKFTGIPEFGQD